MSILLEFSMFPTDHGESKSNYVSRVIDLIDRSGYPYKLTPMSTVVETRTMDQALGLVKEAYETLEPDCNRIYSIVKFDIRKNSSNRLAGKIDSIQEKLGREVRS